MSPSYVLLLIAATLTGFGVGVVLTSWLTNRYVFRSHD